MKSTRFHLVVGLICLVAVAAGVEFSIGDPGRSVDRMTPREGRAIKPFEGTTTTLIGIGDSLTHGTMDGTNNSINTLNAYLQRIADSLEQVMPLRFSQPLFDEQQERLMPFRIPTNVAVDGANTFSIEGIEYYKRVGADESFLNEDYLCDVRLPRKLDSKSDKVMYPINLRARMSVSQVDAAEWLMGEFAAVDGKDRAVAILWIGNNESSSAALGSGGENPTYMPVPVEQIEPEINRDLRFLLRVAQDAGIFSTDAYAYHKIVQHLTETEDFVDQYRHVLDRLTQHPAFEPGNVELFLLTLPYYSAVGYLFDSEDLEFYLRQLDPAYSVPATFQRVAPIGEPITDPLRGDRVSLLTFGFMYTLLHSGYSVEYINGVLETDGVQRDDMVLSQAEQQFIMARIDSYNAAIRDLAAQFGPAVHLVGVGEFLNDAFTGKTPLEIAGRTLNRKWTRGGGFSLDGVHPGFTGQALIANFVLSHINETLGVTAPLFDLAEIFASDPYVDQDGDGWATGPVYEASGLTELLFMLTDPNDTDASVKPVLPPNVWDLLSDAMLEEVLGVPSIRRQAQELGIVPRY